MDRGNTTTPMCSSEQLDGSGGVDLNSPRMRAALSLLVQASAYAHDVGRGIWDFAVEINELRRIGLTVNDLRWLVCAGFIHHGRGRSTDEFHTAPISLRRESEVQFTLLLRHQ